MSKLPDLDEVFSYQTQQELNVLDRRLGQIFIVSFFFIFIYIVVFVRSHSLSKLGLELWDQKGLSCEELANWTRLCSCERGSLQPPEQLDLHLGFEQLTFQ